MSSILGIFDRPDRLPTPALFERMRNAMSLRGTDACGVHRDGVAGALLSTARFTWELAPDFSGPVQIVERDGIVVAADARIYYRNELRTTIARRAIEPRGDTPSDLILAAYRAFGAACAEHLEGDYAFIVWDAGERRVFGARSNGGQRPLYVADLGDTFLVGSSIAGLIAHPFCPEDLNLAALGDDVASMNGSLRETCYQAVERVPAGWSFRWQRGSGLRMWRHWTPPEFGREVVHGPTFEEAADELRDVLTRAVSERLGAHTSTSVWLSGGRDSTAVFGAGKAHLERMGGGMPLLATSVSYPPGDSGREDETIQSIADFWRTPVRWVDASRVALFDGAIDRAAARDEPYPHCFASLLMGLARLDQEAGVGVSLDGTGGDQSFSAPDIFYSDLFRQGRWLRLAREWRLGPYTGIKNFFRFALNPALSPEGRHRLERLRGGRKAMRVGADWTRTLPAWIDADFARRYRLAEREEEHVEARGRRSYSDFQAYWTLTAPRFSQLNGYLAEYALVSGAEHRAPFYDRRVIAYAASRPRSDHNFAGDTKRLLRAATKGLVPDEVLAPRPVKTGRAHGYTLRETRSGFPSIMELLLRDSILAELGMIDHDLIRRAWDQFLAGGRLMLATQLGTAVEIEAWLRARYRPESLQPKDCPSPDGLTVAITR